MEIFDYIERMNSGPELFPDVLSYAREYKVPIMDFDALQVMKHYIHLTGVERILEVGTGTCCRALHSFPVGDGLDGVTTKNTGDSHRRAKEFFEAYGVSGRLDPVLQDASGIGLETLREPFDVRFVEASEVD